MIRTRNDSTLIKFKCTSIKVINMFKTCKPSLIPLVQHFEIDTCLWYVSFISFIWVSHSHKGWALIHGRCWLLIYELLLDSLIRRQTRKVKWQISSWLSVVFWQRLRVKLVKKFESAIAGSPGSHWYKRWFLLDHLGLVRIVLLYLSDCVGYWRLIKSYNLCLFGVDIVLIWFEGLLWLQQVSLHICQTDFAIWIPRFNPCVCSSILTLRAFWSYNT
jgi:hypothetical protein